MISTPQTNYEPLEDLMISLKQVANDNDCILFIDSQLSANVEVSGKLPQLSDFESKAIENLSDIVLFIDRYEKGLADIIVAKNKYGMLGTCTIRHDIATGKFFDTVK